MSVQGAEPRAGWAQQYTPAGAPAAARAFEVPALATWETRHAIEALLALAEATGERSYCESALRAARWLDAIRVGPACWARFVDPADGRAIFVDEAGARVATSAKARPGYSWMGEFGIPWVLRRHGRRAERRALSRAGRSGPVPRGPGAAAPARRAARARRGSGRALRRRPRDVAARARRACAHAAGRAAAHGAAVGSFACSAIAHRPSDSIPSGPFSRLK